MRIDQKIFWSDSHYRCSKSRIRPDHRAINSPIELNNVAVHSDIIRLMQEENYFVEVLETGVEVGKVHGFA